MKKKKLLLILIAIIMLLPGCNFTKDSMEDITIYTTIYPVRYLIDSLYGEYSTIYSVYPSGVNPNEYELSEKKIKEYANSELKEYDYNDISKLEILVPINVRKEGTKVKYSYVEYYINLK